MEEYGINVLESIKSGWLKRYGNNLFVKIWDNFFTCFFNGVILTIGYWWLQVIYTAENDNESIFGYAIAGICLPVGIYFFIRQVLSNRLLTVKTYLPAKDARNALIEFYTQRGDNIIEDRKLEYSAEDLAEFTEDELNEEEEPRTLVVHVPSALNFTGSTDNYQKYSFIFEQGRVHFCAYSFGEKMDRPVLFSHLIMKSDLKKFFQKWA